MPEPQSQKLYMTGQTLKVNLWVYLIFIRFGWYLLGTLTSPNWCYMSHIYNSLSNIFSAAPFTFRKTELEHFSCFLEWVFERLTFSKSYYLRILHSFPKVRSTIPRIAFLNRTCLMELSLFGSVSDVFIISWLFQNLSRKFFGMVFEDQIIDNTDLLCYVTF